jgi:acyl-coenzyme A synthetase/AMP-(fatty) acid ligase
VFSDRYLRDLVARMPHADVHRYEGARHLVIEDDARCVADIITWISRLREGRRSFVQSVGRDLPDMNASLRGRAEDTSVAIADMRSGLRVSWQRLAARTEEIARGMVAWGVAPGDRVALLVTPGPDLIASVYAAWSIGAVVVVADSGLGLRGMRRALRSAEPTHVVGIPAGLGLARTLEIPGRRFLVGRPGATARLLGADATLSEVARRGREQAGVVMPPTPDASVDALVAFTSGATGPAKGVVYTQGRLRALRDALRAAYAITESDALVAAFAPWAVLGPALGIASAIPNMDLTDASTLTSVSFAEATAAVGGTLMWASPTGLRGIVSTADFLTADQRLDLRTLREILVAGAPVPVELLAEAAALVPTARCSTPYGMTEALPLTATDLAELLSAQGSGVLVGRPLEGVHVAVAPLAADGSSADDTTTNPGVTGEIVVRAPWMRDRYDRRWGVQDRADTPRGWHRTGDVGHLDEQGRLWVEGRLAHVITTADGPVTPVGVELAAQRAVGADLSACVGVGPAGTQAVAVVLQAPGPALGPADVDLTVRVREAVREATGIDVAAVLTMREIPVDVRHRSKVDRARVAAEATELLAGDGGDA